MTVSRNVITNQSTSLRLLSIAFILLYILSFESVHSAAMGKNPKFEIIPWTNPCSITTPATSINYDEPLSLSPLILQINLYLIDIEKALASHFYKHCKEQPYKSLKLKNLPQYKRSLLKHKNLKYRNELVVHNTLKGFYRDEVCMLYKGIEGLKNLGFDSVTIKFSHEARQKIFNKLLDNGRRLLCEIETTFNNTKVQGKFEESTRCPVIFQKSTPRGSAYLCPEDFDFLKMYKTFLRNWKAKVIDMNRKLNKKKPKAKKPATNLKPATIQKPVTTNQRHPLRHKKQIKKQTIV